MTQIQKAAIRSYKFKKLVRAAFPDLEITIRRGA